MKRLLSRSPRVLIAAAALLVAGAAAGPAAARGKGKVEQAQGLAVEVIGSGRPVLMIPGLNSHGDTWRETCAALQPARVQCHIVTLPGFAGQPAVETGAFLPAMRDRLLAYVDGKRLKRPVLMGHSLGGVLALQMAAARPDVAERLIIVDALPFLPAAQNPAATVDNVRPMAEQMRQGMEASDDATFRARAAAAIRNMAHDAQRTEQIRAWGAASDRRTTTQAMFELMTTDLREEVAKIRVPTLVLGAWAGFKPYGATKESTAAIFKAQFAKLDGVRIEMSEAGYHFLMWDDPQWLVAQVRDFMAE